MADKDFVVKNGLVVNSSVLVVNSTNVGVNTATPTSALHVQGTSNLIGNTIIGGNTLTVTANSTFDGNVVINSNTYFNERIYVGNNQQFVALARPVIQAVDNFNGFVQISSQNLANATSGAENNGTDACADLVVFADDTNLGYDKFLDMGMNNSNYEPTFQYITANSQAAGFTLGSTVWQSNGTVNSAVGVVKEITTNGINRDVIISINNGYDTLVPTAGSWGALTDGTISSAIVSSNHRNYAFSIGKGGDGYLYIANGGLTLGTTEGGRRSRTYTYAASSLSFGTGSNTVTLDTTGLRRDMTLAGTNIVPGTKVLAVNSTAAVITPRPTGSPTGSYIFYDQYYDATGNPIVFHVNGMYAENEVARLTGDGNLVVGPNSTPRNAKLVVNGTANVFGNTWVGANLTVTGNTVSGNVYAPSGVFTSSINVNPISISPSQISAGNVAVTLNTVSIAGNTTTSSLNVSSGTFTMGNGSVTNTPTVRVQNSASSANLTPTGIRAGTMEVNTSMMTVSGMANVGSVNTVSINATSTVGVGSVNSSANGVAVNTTAMVIGNSSINSTSNASIFQLANSTATANLTIGSLTLGGTVVNTSTANVAAVNSTSINSTSINATSINASSANIVSVNTSALTFVTANLGSISTTNGVSVNSTAFYIGNSSVGSRLSANNLTTGGISGSANAQINSGSNGIFVDVTTGRIGINNSAPDAALAVTGNANVSGDFKVAGTLTVTGTTNFATTVQSSGNFNPNGSFSLGISANRWDSVFVNVLNASNTGNLVIGTAPANVYGNSTVLKISANGTAYSNLTSTNLSVVNGANTANLTPTDLTIGTSVVNSSAVAAGANVYINTVAATVGTINSSANGVTTNTTTIALGNSSVSATINSTAYTGQANYALDSAKLGGVNAGDYVRFNENKTISGNINFTGTNTVFQAGFTSGNTTLNSTSISTGNSTVNTTVTATAVTTANLFGTLQTASQPQITSVGTLTGLSVSGQVNINGNLVVNGQTAFINATVLDVFDRNITVSKNSASAAASDGAGLTVDLGGTYPNATLSYAFASDSWTINKKLIGNGPTGTIDLGNSSVTWGNTFVTNLYATAINMGSVVVNTSAASLGAVNSSSVNTGSINATAVTTGTANVVSTMGIGTINTTSNGVVMTNTSITMGNSTFTAVANVSSFSLTNGTASANMTLTGIRFGTTVVNSTVASVTSVNTGAVNAASLTLTTGANVGDLSVGASGGASINVGTSGGQLLLGNSSVSATINSTVFSGSANRLGGQDASYYTNATNLTTGTVANTRLPQASTTQTGVVQLADITGTEPNQDFTNNSIAVAPTANALSFVKLYANSIAFSTAATAYANATAYTDSKASNASLLSTGTVSNSVLPIAGLYQTGIVQLVDSYQTNSVTLAATANSVQTAYLAATNYAQGVNTFIQNQLSNYARTDQAVTFGSSVNFNSIVNVVSTDMRLGPSTKLYANGEQGTTGKVLTANPSGVPFWNTPSTLGTVWLGDTYGGPLANGALWFKSDEGALKVYYNEANAGVSGGTDSYWVDAFNTSYSRINQPRAVSIYSPTGTERVTMFKTVDTIYVNQIDSVVSGTTPSIKFTLKYGPDRSALGTEVVVGGITCTNTTAGNNTSFITPITIPANNWVWLETSNKTGTVNELNISINFG